VPVLILLLVYVAAMVGFFGHNQATNFERHFHKRPAGIPPAVWGIVCAVGGPIAACAELIAEHFTARRLSIPRNVRSTPPSAPLMQAWLPAPQLRPAPLPRPATPRRPATRVAQPTLRSPHVLSHAQPHPTDGHRMYLFGVPEAPGEAQGEGQAETLCTAPAARAWSTPQYGALPAGNPGGTDLLPRRDLPRRRS